MSMVRTSIVEEDIGRVLEACQNELLALSGKTLLITGGSGFVGSYLIESIIAFNKMHISAPCHLLLPTRSLDAARAKWPHFFGINSVDWFNWDGYNLGVSRNECDYVIHAASPVDPAIYLQDPLKAMEDISNGTSLILQYAIRAKVTAFLYLSSGAAYGRQSAEIESLSEDDLSAPDLLDLNSCYGEAKRYSELLCRTSGVPLTIARLFAFIGPYQDKNGSFAIPNFIRQATSNKAIHINSDGSAMRTYCYASDLTISLWKLLLNGKRGELYNVGASLPSISISELADLISKQVGNTDVIVEANKSSESRSRYIPNTTKLKQLYSAQISLAEGVRRTLASYKQTLD